MTYHLVGDSTVADGKPGEYPLAGWGGYLAERTQVTVKNWAVGGASTETFLAEGWWRDLLQEVHDGDTLLLQFGHNDEKDPTNLAARGGYADRLRGMVADTRARGAQPILATSVERRTFRGDSVWPSHGDYPNAVRDLAHELDVPLIDLTVFTIWLYEDLGPETSRHLLSNYEPGQYPDWPDGLEDDTHFHEDGARKVAAFVAQSISAIERQGADEPARPRRS